MSSATALHPLLAAAAEGELPGWVRMSSDRREHAARVAKLLGKWAKKFGLSEEEQARWKAAGHLHDALKDEDAEALREMAGPEYRDLPDEVLHGPAAARRLERGGVDDAPFLRAVAWHTLGHPDLDRLGMAVYAADFLEPGRTLRNEWRKGLRERAPDDLEGAVREVLQARMIHLVKGGRPIRPETVAFWNRLSGGESWVGASEL